jgi:hypothetical protein
LSDLARCSGRSFTPCASLKVLPTCADNPYNIVYFGGVTAMESFLSTLLSVPLFQVILLLGLSTTALLFRRIKLALLMNYVFTLFWGYVHNVSPFGSVEEITMFTMVYFGFGIATVLLASCGFLTQEANPKKHSCGQYRSTHKMRFTPSSSIVHLSNSSKGI